MQQGTPRGVALVHALLGDPPAHSAQTLGPAPRRLLGLRGPVQDDYARVKAGAPLPSTPASPEPGPKRSRGRHGRVLLLLLAAIAAIGALIADGPIFTALGAVVLALLALLAGWQLGEHRRVVLQSELDERGDDLRRALSELEIAQAETVRRLSMAVEFRDEDTGAHIERIGRFSTLLAQAIGMPSEFCRRISHAAPLHDVGKVAIPDAILLKPGSLTPEERTIVETHAEEGHRLLRGSSSSILDMGAAIALSHHERWDGGGYPRGLAAETIPIEGRIVAIADVFDALTSHRVYRDAFSVEQAREMMLAEAGKHFDPVLLQAFMDVLDTSGADARARERSDPQSLVAGALEIYSDAMRLGDAELAEEAIAQAIEDGIDPSRLQDEVIAPAMRGVRELCDSGEVDAEVTHRAEAITARVMATMDRYMLARN
ncbi:MAG TPA: HD domain-containing phosphohydrolase [Solirubrobacteraceae bacterium]|nr:HD domain-containing phosphohydrolase [Solirubrobacteraceae bacterium]